MKQRHIFYTTLSAQLLDQQLLAADFCVVVPGLIVFRWRAGKRCSLISLYLLLVLFSNYAYVVIEDLAKLSAAGWSQRAKVTICLD